MGNLRRDVNSKYRWRPKRAPPGRSGGRLHRSTRLFLTSTCHARAGPPQRVGSCDGRMLAELQYPSGNLFSDTHTVALIWDDLDPTDLGTTLKHV